MSAPPSETPIAVQERVVPVDQPRAVGAGRQISGPPTASAAGQSPASSPLLATITRFVNLGSPTDAGTPIFDEKHYAPQAWQVLHNHGVEDNPGFGLVVHPPVGKQLIAIGEALFGYDGLGWRFTGALLGVVMVTLVIADRAPDQPLDAGRRHRRRAAASATASALSPRAPRCSTGCWPSSWSRRSAR